MVKCSKSEVQRLKTALRWKIPTVQRERIQMVLLRESGLTQPAIAAAMGVSLSTVNRAGIKALKPKPNGGRKHENMTLTEEKALLARFAKRAGAGEMLNIHDLKAAYEQAIGHATSDSTVYNLLHRHGWRKLMPRPFHPKRHRVAQDAFKKTDATSSRIDLPCDCVFSHFGCDIQDFQQRSLSRPRRRDQRGSRLCPSPRPVRVRPWNFPIGAVLGR